MMRDALKVYVPMCMALVGVGLALWHWMEPPPPHDLTIASGPEGGAYAAFAERYRANLAAGGLRLEIVHTSGSLENQRLLAEGRAQVAFLQGGTSTAAGDGEPPAGLEALASVYYEPLWVFTRGIAEPERLSQLVGKRIAIGAEGTGTHALATTLLATSGVSPANARLLSLGGGDAAEALLNGSVDAVLSVAGKVPDALQRLVDAPDVRLMDFVQADAYRQRFPYLSVVTLPRGGLDLTSDVPRRPVMLLAPVAQLIARDDINPALVDALLEAARKVHRGPTVFAPLDTFPSRAFLELPLSAEADRYFTSGPSMARRYLPFWAASIVERAIIIIVPLLTLAIPLIKFAPSIYHWQVSNRILKWYRHLKEIEIEARAPLTPERRHVLMTRLAAIERQVEDTTVPSGYAQSLYDLRGHIELVRRYLEGRSAIPPVPEAAANVAATG